MKEKLRIAAIDYGKKRIGIAISDARGVIALPLTVVSSGKTQQETVRNVIAALTSYLSEIKLFIVGLPLLLKGTVGEMAEEVQRFAQILQKETNLEVRLVDERLSSKAAERALIEMNRNRKQRKELSDQTAATLLLQSYLGI